MNNNNNPYSCALIPKRIFYYWGAKQPKPDKVLKCIQTWRDVMPDYDIVEINEDDNRFFDFSAELANNRWLRTVYERKMWAFVADYVRVKVLYDHGGIYFDTDVSALKPFDCFLNEPAFVGMQSEKYTEPAILGSQKGNPLFAKIFDFYNYEIWQQPVFSMPEIFEKFITDERNGVTGYPDKNGQTIIRLPHISIFPERYFIPFRPGQKYSADCITSDTFSIHWFNGSWYNARTWYWLNHKHDMTFEEIDCSYAKQSAHLEAYWRVKKLISVCGNK